MNLRKQIWCVVIGVAAVCSARTPMWAQENGNETTNSYLVTLIEAKLNDSTVFLDDPQPTTDRLWKTVHDSQTCQWVDYLKCRVLQDCEAQMRFGHRTSRLQGIVEGPRPTRTMADVSLGTEIQIFVTEVGGKLLVTLKFESSHMDSGRSDELPPPEMSTNTFASTVKAELNKPRLLSSGNSNVLLLNVQLAN
ncbi:MAG: hypothetical protein KDB03_12550 [Planctomycetales bacterium]|nr:hypothetical protein [Planctomycetales bacterium]